MRCVTTLFVCPHRTRAPKARFSVYFSERQPAKFRRVENDEVRTVIVPANKKEVPHGTLRSIARQAGLSVEDFVTR